MSGLVSILAGLVINAFGHEAVEKILPPTVTGSIAIVIGISLAGTALTGAAGNGAEGAAQNTAWVIALITLVSTMLFSVYLKGTWGQLPILFGIIVGYITALSMGVIDFSTVFSGQVVAMPHFTLPSPNWGAVLAIMPIAIATIPESTAHLYQLDIYVDHLAEQKAKRATTLKTSWA